MSIADDEQQLPSVTEGDRALELFTDRYSFSRLLAERLNNDPAEKTILFFHGSGGNGKSLLLKYLRKNICKRLTTDQWQAAKEKSDEDLANGLERLQGTQHLPVPSALLDFGLTLVGEAQPRDRFYGLLLLRKALGESAAGSVPNWKLTFPRYDFACIWYLHSKGKSPEEIKAMFPLGEAAGLATTLIDVVTKNPAGAVVNAFFSLVSPQIGQKLTLYLSKLGLSTEDFETIRGLDVDRELIERLPEYFAKDLNGAMAEDHHPQRLALFFDTHEAFWGERRNLPREQNFFQDEWLRRLFRQLDLEKGILAVVAGRDVPQWPNAKEVKPRTEIPEKYLRCVEVSNLSAADATVFLEKVGIKDGALRDSLIVYASVREDAVHPLHLGLCADVVLEAEHNGHPLSAEDFTTVPDAFDEKNAQLLEQLLRYVNSDLRYTIHALSACRAFDFEIYQLLGEKLHFTADRPMFSRLLQFSFVRQTEHRGENWYRIHDLMRRLDNAEQLEHAHKVLAKHYQSNQNLEGIYHINYSDWLKGVNTWIVVFNEALTFSRFDICRMLLDIRQDLIVSRYLELGVMNHSGGAYYQKLSLYREAQSEYQEAINNYDQALVQDPEDASVLSNKGFTLQKMADLQTEISQHDRAASIYQLSIQTFDIALKYSLNNAVILSNKGLSLYSLANLQVGLSNHKEAAKTYRCSIQNFDKALEHNLDNIGTILHNKALALRSLADLQAGLWHSSQAIEHYKCSIQTFDKALEHAPKDVEILNHKGIAFQRLADLQTELSQYKQALESYQLSIEIANTVLKQAPEYIDALNHRGFSLQSLADLQTELSQYKQALKNYELSIESFDHALELAHGYVIVLSNKGVALQRLAYLQTKLSNYEQATATYQCALQAFDTALVQAPNDTSALNNKGASLQSLARLQAQLSQLEQANMNYQFAIQTFDTLLELAPNLIQALNNKGSTYLEYGFICWKQEQPEKAHKLIQAGITCWNNSLELAPNNSSLQERRDEILAILKTGFQL